MGEYLSIEHRMLQAEKRWGHVFERKNQNEASGACPFCPLADDDGFLIFSNGGYWCRQCGVKGWINEEDAKPPTAQELLEMRIAKLERQQAEQELRIHHLEEMHRCKDHLIYHDNLTDEAREYWWREGITDESIERYLLGWCPSCPMCRESASYTIPIFDRQHQLVNIRHRLEKPNGGKYRPHRANLGIQLFNAGLLDERRDRIIIAEGEKKGIILTQSGFPTVAITGKRAFLREWLDLFKGIEIVVALDPDAQKSAHKLGQLLAEHGAREVRIAQFTEKPDDMIVKRGASSNDIEQYLRWARPVRGKTN